MNRYILTGTPDSFLEMKSFTEVYYSTVYNNSISISQAVYLPLQNVKFLIEYLCIPHLFCTLKETNGYKFYRWSNII